MTKEHYAANIAANIANKALNDLVTDYATVAVERDELKAKVAALEAKYEPKPEATQEAGPSP